MAMTDSQLVSHISHLLTHAEDYNSVQSQQRERALEYYNGEMEDVPHEDGRSSVISKDLRAMVRKLMPSIMRTLFGGDKYVEYMPVGMDDDAYAAQATEYINHVVMPECNGEDALYDAVFDAILLRSGILKWCAVEQDVNEVHEYSNYNVEEMEQLEGEGLSIEEIEGNDDGTVNFKVRRTGKDTKIMLESVPRASFLIHPSSDELYDNPLVGERMYITRSDLVDMGYDRATVYDLVTSASTRHYDETEEYNSEEEQDRQDVSHDMGDNRAMETVLVHKLYVRIDQDDDGIAELYCALLAEGNNEYSEMNVRGDSAGGGGNVLLEFEEVDEVPYSKVVIERRAHSFDGHSISDDILEIQRVKTVMLRETLDNIYWQNTPQPAVDRSKVYNMDAVMNPTFGRPIFLKANAKVQDALQWTNVPFIGDKSLSMLDYMDRVAKERTGITDMSGGVDPKVFEHMAATSASMLSESGTAQADMIIRTLSKGGIRDAFRGLLRLVVAHVDVDYRRDKNDQWTQYSPHYWNSNMDCMVNVGLGAGSKDRDLQVLQLVKQMQSELIGAFGPDNPFVNSDNLYNMIERVVETAGFPSAKPYFTRPDPEEVKQRLQQAAQQEDPQIMLEQMKAQARSQVEAAQLQADLQVKDAELRNEQAIEVLKLQHQTAIEDQKAQHVAQLERLRLAHDWRKHEDDIDIKQQQVRAAIAKARQDNANRNRPGADGS